MPALRLLTGGAHPNLPVAPPRSGPGPILFKICGQASGPFKVARGRAMLRQSWPEVGRLTTARSHDVEHRRHFFACSPSDGTPYTDVTRRLPPYQNPSHVRRPASRLAGNDVPPMPDHQAPRHGPKPRSHIQPSIKPSPGRRTRSSFLTPRSAKSVPDLILVKSFAATSKTLWMPRQGDASAPRSTTPAAATDGTCTCACTCPGATCRAVGSGISILSPLYLSWRHMQSGRLRHLSFPPRPMLDQETMMLSSRAQLGPRARPHRRSPSHGSHLQPTSR